MEFPSSLTSCWCFSLQGVPRRGPWTMWLPDLEDVASESLWHETRRMWACFPVYFAVTILINFLKCCSYLSKNGFGPRASLFLSFSISVAGVSEAYEDAANCLWLLTNSKSCANCKSPIQKNEGCNHMQCAKVICVIRIIGFIYIPGEVWGGGMEFFRDVECRLDKSWS